MNIQFESIVVFLLVLVRITGMFLFNPILARRNMPARLRMGLVLCLTILIAPTLSPTEVMAYDAFDLTFAMLRELFVGFVCGYAFQMFYYLLFFVGDFLDVQFGMSMAKVFDPGTNIQMSVTGNFLSILFMLYIFATDSHLLLLKIFSSSFSIVPLGATGVSLDAAKFVIDLFIAVFMLIIRLALPFAVAEFTLEVAMGVLMKIIPQIHVFVINIQLKMAMGLLLLFLFAGSVASFMDQYIILLFENMQRALVSLAG